VTFLEEAHVFAIFFKRYMSVSTLVVASLPIPVTAFQLVPTFKAQTRLLSVYTPLFCFLVLGFIFYSRHQLARLMFPGFVSRDPVFDSMGNMSFSLFKRISRSMISLLPLVFIVASVVLVFEYQFWLNDSVAFIGSGSDFEEVLERTGLHQIPHGAILMVLYIGIFLTAEAAFVMMAIKEYLQDLVGLTEIDLIKGPPVLVEENQILIT